jgi:hypothetical protein
MNKIFKKLLLLLSLYFTASQAHTIEDNKEEFETLQIEGLCEKYNETHNAETKRDFFQFICLVCAATVVYDSFDLTAGDDIIFALHPVSTLCKVGGRILEWTGKGWRTLGYYCEKIGI